MKSSIYVLFAFLFLQFIILSSNEKYNGECYGLALEGGGTRGVYQAGAYQAFSEKLSINKSMSYDIFTGVSVGSLSGLVLASFEVGREKEVSKILSSLWLTAKAREIFRNWKDGGIVRGIFFESGIVDSEPERELIESTFNKIGGEIKRVLSMGMTDVNEGKYYTPSDLNNDNVVNYTMGSSALPGMFPPVSMNNRSHLFIDGVR